MKKKNLSIAEVWKLCGQPYGMNVKNMKEKKMNTIYIWHNKNENH